MADDKPVGIFEDAAVDAADGPIPLTPQGRQEAASLKAEMGFDWANLDKIRNNVEKELKPIPVEDIMSGTASQEVWVIPKKYKVRFRVVNADHRGAILKEVTSKFGVAAASSQEGLFYHQVVTLACSISHIQEAALPDVMPEKFRGSQTIDKESFETNKKAILSMPDMLFWMVWFNYTWFIERAQSALTMEALGNG
jgi:hypothetical protein